MSLFKKLGGIFSSKKENATDELQKIWIFREPRLKGASLQGISLKSSSGETYRVANISATGIALSIDSLPSSIEIGKTIQGTLKVMDDELEVSATAVRVDRHVIGFAFNQKSSVLDRILRKYFQIEIAALKMMPMNPEHLAPTPDGTPHSFNGNSGDKLYFIESKGKVQYFELNFLGNDLEASLGKPIRIRKSQNELSRTDLKYQVTISEKSHQSIESPEKIRSDAERFVFHIEKLDTPLKQALIEALSTGTLK